MNTLLESLSSNASFTDDWKFIAEEFINLRNTTLTARQQGVYVLACLKMALMVKCSLNNENATLCLNAITLMKCPIGIPSLVDYRAVRSCKKDSLVSVFPDMLDSLYAESFVDSACPMIEKETRSAAECLLQAAGLASGDSVDLAAVETAISASTVTTDSEKARQQVVLDICRDNGDDTVDAFLDCWGTMSYVEGIISSAERLAKLATVPTWPGRGPPCAGQGWPWGWGRGRGRAWGWGWGRGRA